MIVLQHICPQESRPSFIDSLQGGAQHRRSYALSLPCILHEDADIGGIAVDVDIAEAYAPAAVPCDEGISLRGRRYDQVSVGCAISDSMEPAIEALRGAACEHGDESVGISLLEHADPESGATS